MTNYYRDNWKLYGGKTDFKRTILDFLSNSRNSNLLNSFAGLVGIIGGLLLII